MVMKLAFLVRWVHDRASQITAELLPSVKGADITIRRWFQTGQSRVSRVL